MYPFNLSNFQPYPVSVRNFPGPECGVFCILIIDIVLGSVLVVFSVLRARNYHYNKGPPKVEFFKCKTNHNILVHIAVLQSILIWQVINIVLIYIIARYTCGGTFSANANWPTKIILFLLCFVLNYPGTLLFSRILNLFICGIFEHNCFTAVKEIHKLWFLMNNNKCRNKVTVSQTKLTLKYWELSGASWSCWGRSWIGKKSPGFR